MNQNQDRNPNPMPNQNFLVVGHRIGLMVAADQSCFAVVGHIDSMVVAVQSHLEIHLENLVMVDRIVAMELNIIIKPIQDQKQ